MSINITGKHVEVGESLSRHIEEKVNGISSRYFGEPIEAHVVLEKDHHLFKIDFSVHISRNFIVRTHASHTDPYHACDMAADKMETRIKKYKARLQSKKRQAPSPEALLASAQQYVLDHKDDDKGDDTPLTIAEMEHTIETLTVGEAVMRMDLSEQPTLVFINPKHGGLNVVYKRQDGNIGWIDPSIQKN